MAERHGTEPLAHRVELVGPGDVGNAGRKLLRDHASRGLGCGFDDALRRLYAVDDQGRLLRGVDVFIAIWRRLPGYRWLGALAGFPLVRPFAWFVYEYLVSYPVSRWSRRRLRKAQALG